MKKYVMVLALALISAASFSHDGKTDKTKKAKAESHKHGKDAKCCSGAAPAGSAAAPACCQKGGAKACHGAATAAPAPAATPTAPVPAGR